jgi:hypothetical protein
MKIYAGREIEVYEVSGQELRIHWDIIKIIKDNETSWEANEAICGVSDSRSSIIEKIIGSVYSTGKEIATINNKEADPESYEEYQAFREFAKQLADGWVKEK